jgi:hypothetical protein
LCSSGSSARDGGTATRVVTNKPLVRRRARLGRFCTIGGFGALLGGLVYSWFGIGDIQDTTTIFISYAALIAGYILISVGKNNWLRFSLHPRPDEALAINLKTLDAKTTLFNYVPSLPVEHLLSTPNGMVAVETRPFVSEVRVNGERWSRQGLGAFLQFFSEGALGNPGREAQRSAAAVKSWLIERIGPEAESISVEPLVVLTHPRARFAAENPAVPVAHARDARNEVKRLTSGPRLAPDLARRVEALLSEESRPYGEPVHAGDAVDKRARVRRRKPAKAR